MDEKQKGYRYIYIILGIMCFLLICVNQITTTKLTALEEECRLNAAHYEKEIDNYNRAFETQTRDFLLCELTIHNLIDKCKLTLFEIGEVYYDNSINRFVHIREKTDTGYLVGVARSYRDSQTTILLVPMIDLYMIVNLEQIENIKDYADYNGIGWFVR